MLKIREDSALGIYMSLKESGSVSDFPNIMADVLHKILLEAFQGFPSQYDLYTGQGDLADFKTHNRKWLSETQDLLDVGNGKPYKNGKFADRGYSITAGTFGRTFNLMRETVINDDLNAFKKVPAAMGRAAKRTLVKAICAILEKNGAAYDGTAMFASRSITDSNGNTVTDLNAGLTNLTADATGISTLQAGMLAIATAHDPDVGEIMGLTAKFLVVAPKYAEIARWLLHATGLIGSTSSLATNPLLNPALTKNQQPLTLVVEPFLTAFPSRWYLFADPNECSAIEVGYLNGQKEPELFMKSSDSVRIAGGGRDDFGYNYDDIEYKVRWDYGIAAAFYQAAYKGGN